MDTLGFNAHPREWDTQQLIDHIIDEGILKANQLHELALSREKMIRLIELFETDAE